jgi:hypothetical protein
MMKHKLFVPINSHYGYLKKLEFFKLEAKFSENYIAPQAPVMESINHNGAIWKIELANGKSCFMKNKFCAIDKDLYVVHVDAQKFYFYWLISSLYLDDQHRSNHCVLVKDMPNDYKFKDAADGFSRGLENPVPLAYLSARYENGNPYIGFTNGVTRTMWLLANGAKSFPIEVQYEESAKHLFEFAGVGEPPLTYQNLKDKFDVKTPFYLTREYLDRFDNEKDTVFKKSAEVN